MSSYKEKKLSKIGKAILIRVILFSSFVTLLLTSVQLFLEFKTDYSQVEEVQQLVDKSYLKSLETAVWGINEAQATALLEGIVVLPTVTHVSIKNEDGSDYISQTSSNKKAIKDNTEFTRNLYSPNGTQTRVIATLKIEQSQKHAYENLKKRIFVVLSANFIKTFLVAAFILYVFHTLVSRHLQTISNFLKDSKAFYNNDKLILDRPSSSSTTNDELDVFVQSFNNVQQELNSSWQNLENSEKRYRILVEGSIQGILIIDKEWNFLYANKQLFNILGISKEDKYIENPKAHFNEEARLIVNSYFSNNNQQKNINEITLLTKNKDARYVQAIFMHTKLDKKPALQIVIFDISHLKKMKEKQRDYELLLIQKNKMESIGLMLSGVTHEINNPNYLIKQNSIILKETWEDIEKSFRSYSKDNPTATFNNLTASELNSVIPELIDDIHQGSENISKIITDLKLFISQDQSQYVEFLDINDIINDVSRTLRIVINNKCKNFKLDLCNNLPKVWVYRQRISQVFINLIINALEALRDNSETIKISTTEVTNGVSISFFDEGSGISQENKEKVFDTFFTTKSDTGGTGLGLSISQSIIMQHHSEIKISSNLIKGTEFKITLPTNKKPQEKVLHIQ